MDLGFGVEHQGFVLLEFGRDVALGVDQGLLAQVVCRGLVRHAAADLDVIAKNLVVSHLEGLDARALLFPGFQPADPVPGVGRSIDDVVQFGGISSPDDAHIVCGCRRIVRDGLLQEFEQAGVGFEFSQKGLERGGFRGQEGQNFRQQGQVLAQGNQVWRADAAAGCPVHHAFDIVQALEQGHQVLAQHPILMEKLYQIQARVDGLEA